MSETHKPKYFCWYEEDFWSDRRVVRMPSQARHFYRALLCAALFCRTRPYLPLDDDIELQMLADCTEPLQWEAHRDTVMSMFTKTEHGYSHPRLIEQWEIVQKGFAKWSEMGKVSAAARAAKKPTAVEPQLNPGSTDIGSGHWTLDSGSGNGFGNGSTSHRVNDSLSNDASQTPPVSKASDPVKTPASNAKANDDIDWGGVDRNDEAADLAEFLHSLLTKRQDKIVIRPDWKKLFTADFAAALRQTNKIMERPYTFAEVKRAIVYSQLPRNQQYYVRSAGILKSIGSLVDQANPPAARKEIAALLRAAESGKLPPPKKQKSVTEAMVAAPAASKKGKSDLFDDFELPNFDKPKGFEVEEDLE